MAIRCKSLKELELPPHIEEALYVQGYSQYQQGYYLEAVQYFQRLAAGCRKTSKYWFGLAACYQMLNSYEGAVAFYIYAAFLDPNNPILYFHAAECCISLRKFQDATSLLNRVLELIKGQESCRPLASKVQALQEAWGLHIQTEEIDQQRKKKRWLK